MFFLLLTLWISVMIEFIKKKKLRSNETNCRIVYVEIDLIVFCFVIVAVDVWRSLKTLICLWMKLFTLWLHIQFEIFYLFKWLHEKQRRDTLSLIPNWKISEKKETKNEMTFSLSGLFRIDWNGFFFLLFKYFVCFVWFLLDKHVVNVFL